MGKFGIGARVRDTDGGEGVVTGKRKGEREVVFDGGISYDLPATALRAA